MTLFRFRLPSLRAPWLCGVCLISGYVPAAQPATAQPATAQPATTAQQPQFVDENQQAVEPTAQEQQAYQQALAKFDEARRALAAALTEQREVYIRYVNREQRTPAAKQQYQAKRYQTRQILDLTFQRGLDVTRTRILNDQIVRFLVNAIRDRLKYDHYDAETFEGAAKMIDAGQNMMFLFSAAARSALVSGEFDAAEKLFRVLVESDGTDEIDKVLYANLDRYREQWEIEQQIRQREAEQDRLPRVKLTTTQGDVVLELFLDQAPTTVTNFMRLVDDGFYDGLDFYQVIDHALALTGDPTGAGNGNSGKFIVDEHQRSEARGAFRGSLVMAKVPLGSSGHFIPNSASSQFAILFLPVASVTDQQTVFGRVVEGMETVSRLRRVDPNQEKKKGEIVVPPDSIITATVTRRPPALPEPEYVQPPGK
jgi:peptidylprolyl isomerase